MKKWVG